MGLDTTHGCWSGAYSSFNRWRKELAHAAGLPPLEFMEGYAALNPLVKLLYDKGLISHVSGMDLSGQLPIHWSCLKEDPLIELLDHSDCDGNIPWKHCIALSDRLMELAPEMPEEWRERTEIFSDGLIDAAKQHKDVEFG